MVKLLSLAKGYKTYAAVALGLGWGAYAYFTGDVNAEMPWYAAFILAALGFHRAAISTQAKQTEDVLNALVPFVENILQELHPVDPAVKPLEKGLEIKTSSGTKVILGLPTPEDVSEEDVTAALNKFQVK